MIFGPACVSFPRLEKFSLINSLSKFFAPVFSLFSFWASGMSMLACLILFQKSLKLSSLKKLFSVQLG